MYVQKSFGDSVRRTGTGASTRSWRAGACQPGRSWSASVMRELGLEPCQPRPKRFSLTEGAARPPPAGPRAAGLHRRRARREAGRGHHLYPDVAKAGSIWPPSSTAAPRKSSGTRWTITTRPRYIDEAIKNAARNRPLAAKATSTPTAAATTCPLSTARPCDAQPPALGRSDRNLLRQRHGRIVLRRAEERTGEPHGIQHARGSPTGHHEIHRILVRIEARAPGSSVPDPRRSPTSIWTSSRSAN